MEILYHPLALKELEKLNKAVQDKFLSIFKELARDVALSRRKVKRLVGTNLLETRVRDASGIYRGLGGIVKPNLIIVLFFKKTSQKLPRRILRTAESRLKRIELE